MTKDTDKFVVEQLYDVVSSPDRYDEFMRALGAEMASIKEMTQDGPSDQLQSHLKRASGLVDIVTPWPSDGQNALDAVPSISIQPMIAADYTGQILDANRAARIMYDLTPDSTLSDLPLDSGDQERLQSMIRDVIGGHDKRNAPNDVIHLQNVITERPVLITVCRHRLCLRFSSVLREGFRSS